MTFCYRTFPKWASEIWELVEQYVSRDAIARFKRHPFEIAEDDLSWLDEIADANGISLQYLLADDFESRFSSLRAYHATNTSDVESYLKHGLIPLDVDSMSSDAFDFFQEKLGTAVSPQDLHASIEQVGVENRKNRVYFSLVYEFLIEYCGHYLIYGSEYMSGIATRLSNLTGMDCKKWLRNTGEPTMFVCDVPTSLVPESLVHALVGRIVTMLFKHLLNPSLSIVGEFGIWITEPLPPSCIVDHFHPTEVREPFTKEVYRYDS